DKTRTSFASRYIIPSLRVRQQPELQDITIGRLAITTPPNKGQRSKLESPGVIECNDVMEAPLRLITYKELAMARLLAHCTLRTSQT
ncbi:glycosyl hydrolase family 43 protein, partial [Moniliophthora roreri]